MNYHVYKHSQYKQCVYNYKNIYTYVNVVYLFKMCLHFFPLTPSVQVHCRHFGVNIHRVRWWAQGHSPKKSGPPACPALAQGAVKHLLATSYLDRGFLEGREGE